MGRRKYITLWEFIKEMFKRAFEDGVFDLAAQLAYYFLLSLFPFLIFTFSLIPYLGLNESDILNYISRYAPPELLNLIKANLKHVLVRKGSGIISFSVIATLWPASNAINSIIRALNQAYKVKETRPFIIARIISIFLTVAMIFVIVFALGLNVFGHVISQYIFNRLGLSDLFITFWNYARMLISFIVITVVFILLYYLAPNRRLRLNDVLYGSVFASVGWQVASFAFSFYVSRFGRFSATYGTGTLDAIVVLMVWFYITALIIILGGMLNAVNRYFKDKLDDS